MLHMKSTCLDTKYVQYVMAYAIIIVVKVSNMVPGSNEQIDGSKLRLQMKSIPYLCISFIK